MKKAKYLDDSRGANLGARLRRLSATIDRDASRTYDLMGVKFEQRWFGLLDQLIINGPMSVQEIAESLGITHVSVSQSRQSLEKAGYICSRTDKNDRRRKEIHLTSRGHELIEKLTPLWQALVKVAIELNEEGDDLVAAIDKIELALKSKSLDDRVQAILPTTAL